MEISNITGMSEPAPGTDAAAIAAEESAVLLLIRRLKTNAWISKNSHFYASLRRRHLHIGFGLPAVIINLLLGSVFFTLLQAELPDWGKWLGAVLALVAAALGGIQTFFDFNKKCSGHREVGNDYLELARECERLLAMYQDGLMPLQQLAAELPRLNAEYADINERAEMYIVTSAEYDHARRRVESSAGLFE